MLKVVKFFKKFERIIDLYYLPKPDTKSIF